MIEKILYRFGYMKMSKVVDILASQSKPIPKETIEKLKSNIGK